MKLYFVQPLMAPDNPGDLVDPRVVLAWSSPYAAALTKRQIMEQTGFVNMPVRVFRIPTDLDKDPRGTQQVLTFHSDMPLAGEY